MFKNYLKTAFRNFKRHKGYTFINIFGLAVGFACCILIATYIRDEMSHEDFQQNAKQLMFVGMKYSYSGTPRIGMSTPYPLADALEQKFPSVREAVTTLWPSPGKVSINGKYFNEEEGVFYAGEGFFDIFSFPVVQGTSKHDLREPNTAVISTELAQKYFPDENPIGQTLIVNKRGTHTFRIVGVAKSNDHSYLDFNAVLSLSTLGYAKTYTNSWGTAMFQTYVLLDDGTSIKEFKKQTKKLAIRKFGKKLKRSFVVQPLTGLYLSDLTSSNGFRGSWHYIYIFGAVVLFILIIACVNYINLSTAQAAQRAKEVGVRKTVGANRSQLIFQFLGEAVLMSAMAYIIGLLLAWYALPAFNHLFDMQLSLGGAGTQWLLLLAGITLGVGILAGSYPALYLSGFESSKVLKGRINNGTTGSLLRRGLLVTQFTIAVVLIIGTAFVYKQLRYTQKKDLGFNGEQVVITNVPDDASQTFKREVLSYPAVISASVTGGIPGRFNLTIGRPADFFSPKAETDDPNSIRLKPAVVDYSYIPTLKIKLLAGRNFSTSFPSDKKQGLIINKTFARALGWSPKEAIGKPLSIAGGGKVVGVVKDFHIASFRHKIMPVVLSLHGFKRVFTTKQFIARLKPDSIQVGLRHIEEVRSHFTDEPFKYTFLNDEFAEMHKTVRRFGDVFGAFAIIAIFLACLGLFGLSALSAERRTKEIGIRKVLGASVSNIMGLLSKDFLKLVLIGFLIAVPAAWYFMHRWLQNFAYKIHLSPWIFILAGVIAVIIALATVSWQSIRAALANPVDSLRSE